MIFIVFCILLFVVLLYVSWNVIVKVSGDKMYVVIGVSGLVVLIVLVMFFFVL